MQRSARFDLLVRGGRLVVPHLGQVDADIGIVAGRIAAIGEGLGAAEAVLDAAGRLVLPGIFDPHVHIGNQHAFTDEAESETRAGILGGITTVGVFIRSLQDSYLQALPELRAAMDTRSYADSIFHPQTFTPQQIAEIPLVAAAFGVRSFKFYMSGLPGIVDAVDDGLLLAGLRAVAALGPDAVACVHCENGALVQHARAALQRDRPEGTLADWAAAHPPEAEALAIQTASSLARLAGAHLYVVHLSSRQGFDAVLAARRAGTAVTVETTTPFLGLTSADSNGLLLKMVPPVRSAEHGDALWQGLREGVITTVGTDNTSRDRAAKQPGAGLHGARPGQPALGTHLPALLHYGRLRGVSLQTLVECATSNPARTFGLYPRKGAIAPGADADLVIVDPDLERVVRAADLQGMSDYSPFEGKTLRGWPVATIKAGVVVARDGRITAAPSGRYLMRAAP